MAGQAVVRIKDGEWIVSLAVTPWEMEQGLGGLPELQPGTGMLFDLGFEQTIHVTTIPMLFPLDIAFLSEELTVTEVYRNVEPGYLVDSIHLARYFIEVNAGELEGIESGDAVSVELLPFEEMPAAPDWLSMMFGLTGFLLLGTIAVSIARDFTGKAFEEPELNPALLPQVSSRKLTGYELDTDRMGNIIIRRSDGPKKDVFLQFESDKALVYDLLKKGERKDLDAGWKVKINRNEPRASILDELWENSAQPQRLPATAKKPARDDVTVETWQERDRLGIWITDKRTDKVIAEWWDEDAREMFEQGFFKPGVPQRTTEKSSMAFIDSVLDYAESVGLLAGGKYLAQTVKEAYFWTALNKDTGEIAESYTPYTNSGRALRAARAFASKTWIGNDARLEVWRKPHAYSEKSHDKPVASELLLGYRSVVAVARAESRARRHGSPGNLEFLPDSPEYLAYTIDDIGYRDRIDSAFLNAIARSRGKRS